MTFIDTINDLDSEPVESVDQLAAEHCSVLACLCHQSAYMVLRCFPEVYRHALSLQFYNRLTYDCAAFHRFGNKHSRLTVLTLLLLFNPSLTFYSAKPICFVTTTTWLGTRTLSNDIRVKVTETDMLPLNQPTLTLIPQNYPGDPVSER